MSTDSEEDFFSVARRRLAFLKDLQFREKRIQTTENGERSIRFDSQGTSVVLTQDYIGALDLLIENPRLWPELLSIGDIAYWREVSPPNLDVEDSADLPRVIGDIAAFMHQHAVPLLTHDRAAWLAAGASAAVRSKECTQRYSI